MPRHLFSPLRSRLLSCDQTSLTDADAKTNACIVNMEKNLVFLGAVAIEDKLRCASFQESVCSSSDRVKSFACGRPLRPYLTAVTPTFIEAM